MAELLQVHYGPQTNELPSLSAGSRGSMYVHTGSTSTSGIYDATLYFDLGTEANPQRFQIQSSKANSVAGGLTIYLGEEVAANKLGDGNWKGASDVTWIIPYANGNTAGLLTGNQQNINGVKIFAATPVFNNGISVAAEKDSTMSTILPGTTDKYNLGSTQAVWKNIYATTFHGALDGNATTATTADKLKQINALTFAKNENSTKSWYGASAMTITLDDLVDGTIPLGMIPSAAIERIYTYGDQATALQAINNGEVTMGDLVKITENGETYYIKQDLIHDVNGNVRTTPLASISTFEYNSSTGVGAAEKFVIGTAAVAERVANSLILKIAGVEQTRYNGSGSTKEFNVPLATAAIAGLVSINEQTFSGKKIFNDAVQISGAFAVDADASMLTITPKTNNSYDLGSSTLKWGNVYATSFHGTLDGNANTATNLQHGLTIKLGSDDAAAADTFGAWRGGSGETTWILPFANGAQIGLVSAAAQTFNGKKTFAGGVALTAASTAQNITPATNASSSAGYDLGSTSAKWKNVYALTFHGDLDGNAATATTAGKLTNALLLNGTDGVTAESYNGAVANVTLGTYKGATASAAGVKGFVPAATKDQRLYLFRGDGKWASIDVGANSSLSITNTDNGAITISHSTTTSKSTNNATIVAGTGFRADTITVDSTGHVTGYNQITYTLNVSQQADYTSGDKIATIAGTDIYSGIKWETF